MKRFAVKSPDSDLFVEAVHSDGRIDYIHQSQFAIRFRVRSSAEMFVRFLGTLTDLKLSIVEV